MKPLISSGVITVDNVAVGRHAARDAMRVFMLIPVFGPDSDSLPSPFGQGAGVP